MKTKNSRLLFFAVDPCKRIDTNEHKETLIYNWICCGSLEVINTNTMKEICTENYNCGIQRRTQNTKKIVDGGRLSTQRTQMNLIAVDREWSSMVNTKHKNESRADSGLNQRKSGIPLRKRTQHKMLHTKKIDCGSECRSTQLNWMDTEKNEALAKNFNARKTDLSRSTTMFTQINSIQRYTNALLNDWLIDLLSRFIAVWKTRTRVKTQSAIKVKKAGLKWKTTIDQ